MKTHSISKFSSIFTYLEIIQNFFVSSLCWGVIYKENTRLFDAMSYEYHEYYFSFWTNWIVTNIFHETIFLTRFPKPIYLIENFTLYPHDIKRSSMNQIQMNSLILQRFVACPLWTNFIPWSNFLLSTSRRMFFIALYFRSGRT